MLEWELNQHQPYFIVQFTNNVAIIAVSLSSYPNIFAASYFYWATENLLINKKKVIFCWNDIQMPKLSKPLWNNSPLKQKIFEICWQESACTVSCIARILK